MVLRKVFKDLTKIEVIYEIVKILNSVVTSTLYPCRVRI